MSKTEIDLTGMHTRLANLVEAAISLGWRAIDLKHAGVHLQSYDESTEFVVPRTRQVNDNKRRSWTRKVIRYADPVKGAMAEHAFLELMERVDFDVEKLQKEVEEARERVGTSVEAEAVVPRKKKKHHVERTVVSTKPWLAAKRPHKSGGMRYESDTVIERAWDDGVIDFVCSYEGCNYNNENARSVATHHGQKHVRHGDASPASDDAVVPDPSYTEPMSHRYSPTDRLLHALTQFLDDYMADGTTTSEMARLFLTWAHDRPDLERVEREPLELTDAQIVERIRMLVGNPLAQELQASEAALEKARDDLAIAKAEADELREDVETFRSELTDAVQRSELLEKQVTEWSTVRELMLSVGQEDSNA